MLNQPFTNAQLEILKVFSDDLSDEHMKKLKRHLAQFYYEIMTDAADKAWNEQGWDDAKVDELLHTKLRKRK